LGGKLPLRRVRVKLTRKLVLLSRKIGLIWEYF
jgi:hypothetical protein